MTSCTRVNSDGRRCSGVIDELGYCTVCWFAAPAPARPTNSSRRESTGRTAKAPPESPASSSTATGGTTRREALGRGLVGVPSVARRDPSSALLSDPHYPESKRFCRDPLCPTWPTPVGRGRDGRPGAIEGYCTSCGSPFSFQAFEPRLVKGDVVGGRYQVVGYLAHGGVGWIIYGEDQHLGGNPVVLKSLIDTEDPAAQAAAVDERKFLTEVKHPNIVRIYDSVLHPDPVTGTDIGYIVMEYIGGCSLSELRAKGPLPLGQVLAYGLEILAAFEYLHDGKELLYCDLKPANLMHSDEHQLKLIDLGAVRRMDDTDSRPWHSAGYSDPRHWQQPSVASDLYTVARTMAVLSFDFPFKKRVDSLPRPSDVRLLAEHESYHRLLLRATDPDLSRRFESAAAMAEQLRGVLREVAAEDGQPRPEPSTLFGPELRAAGVDAERFPHVGTDVASAALALPDPQFDRSDPQAGLMAGLAGASSDEVRQALTLVANPSVETRRQAVRALIELGKLDEAAEELAALEAEKPHEWRLRWIRGLLALMDDDVDSASKAFDDVYGAVPGEAAPKLALALCRELHGDCNGAERYYERVWRTDRSFISAAFGLARVRFAQGDRQGAVKILDSVPDASRYGATARLAGVLSRVRQLDAGAPLPPDVFDAAERLAKVEVELGPERYHRARIEVLEAVLARQIAPSPGSSADPRPSMLGTPLTERGLRRAIERSYRLLAERHPQVGVELVDRANAVRPWTWR
jgi:serine/threonine-protein kinase PknG